MKRRFTKANISKILEIWPQAIKADDGDLRVLHDLANAGAQLWGESLFWPDYLWLGLDRPMCLSDDGIVERFGVLVQSPQALGPAADLGTIKRRTLYTVGGGRYPLADRIDCILELKAISANHVPKLRNFKPNIPWPEYLGKKLQHIFWRPLEHGDKQIRDCRRIIGLNDARGVTVLVNDGSSSLTPEMVHAFLAKTIQTLPHTDAVVYLSDRPAKSEIATVQKNSKDKVLSRFKEEFSMMLQSVDWNNRNLTVRGGPYPRLTIRIEMDDRTRAMYRNWSTGWRGDDDPTHCPMPILHMEILTSDDI